jgi:threonine/homoserine/homoserine lactone efflux protein
MIELFAVASFVVGATLTPGPSNALVMGSSFNFGVAKSLPLLFGTVLGFPLLIIAFGAGFGVLLGYFPNFKFYLKLIGSCYLLYLAFKLWNVNGLNTNNSLKRPLGFFEGAAFQWVNPKSWINAFGAVSSFSFLHEDQFINSLLLSAIFIAVSFPCVCVWLFAGEKISQFLKTEKHILTFNRTMASLLVFAVFQALRA